MSLVITSSFDRIYQLTHDEGQSDFASFLLKNLTKSQETKEAQLDQLGTNYQLLKAFLQKIIKEIDDLATEIQKDDTILISVRNQKLLRTCFQLITSLGISVCLIPGLGISLSKRCSTAGVLPTLCLTDEQKYEILEACTDFFTRSYKVPVLKNIIITLHLSDYLAALIQLSFAPLKKPGKYKDFTMTEEMYNKLNLDKRRYAQVYEHLVANSFQPILMKELLVLQSVVNPPPPAFFKRVIAKEMSRRLLVPGGLLSLIRCFMETYINIDTGFEWKRIDMICKVIVAKHGSDSQDNYLQNICSQLVQILSSNYTHYLATAVACVLCLNDKYPQSEPVKCLMKEIFTAFDYDSLVLKSNLPGTVILSPQEVEHKVNVLHACVCTTRLDWPIKPLFPNLYMLFLLGNKCVKNEEFQNKLRDTILKCLANLNKNEVCVVMKMFLFGKEDSKLHVAIDEFDAGLAVKCTASSFEHPKRDALLYFLNLFKASSDNGFIQNAFEASLLTLIDLTGKRQKKSNKEMLFNAEDDLVLLDDIDEHYANILQLLSEISTSPKVISSLKSNPAIVLHFIEYFILNTQAHSNEECVTVALILLNTILSNSNKTHDLEMRFRYLVPVLKKMADNDSDFNSILCKEALSLISSEKPQLAETECGKAISNIFDSLLPVRAHGIIELTKLIEAKDPETISKKHYIFCMFQEQLKDSDSYIYLSAVNGIAALGTHCTEDVLQVLCREFIHKSSGRENLVTKDNQNQVTELRLKIGDILVKVTKRLGEMAIVHKTILLNTMLCGCREEDPLIRASALSNLAEIALVLHYRIGSIIYEVLLCVWSIIETDKAVECRRAAVMVISSLIKGLGKETLVELKENLLPIYRSLKEIYSDQNEDTVVRLHAQIALEELNESVQQFLLPELKREKLIFVLDKHEDTFK